MEKCPYCGKECKDKHGVATHIRLAKDKSCYNKWQKDVKNTKKEYDKTHTFVKCMICGKKLRNISNTHLKLHGITQQQYKDQFPNAPLFAEGLLEEQRDKREATISIRCVDENGKRTHYLSLEKCIQQLGEEKGLEKWNAYLANKKYARTEQYYIDKYGKEEGEKRFKERIAACKGQGSLQWYIDKYGEKVGKAKYEKISKKKSEHHKLEYYIEKFGEELGTQKYESINSKKVLTLENFIRIYGQELGTQKYHEYYQNRHNQESFYSKVALELFDAIMQNSELKKHKIYYATKPKEFGVYLKTIGQYTFLDFYDLTTKRCIEFNGDYWHANPLIYEADEIIQYPNKTQTAAHEIWDRDNLRLQAIREEVTENVLIIWESDYYADKDQSIKRCIKFLLSSD